MDYLWRGLMKLNIYRKDWVALKIMLLCMGVSAMFGILTDIVIRAITK
jgi:hypothetical protein